MKTPPRSFAFTAKGDDRHDYLVQDIPGPLWRKIKAQAAKEGLSVRAWILTLLSKRV